ncbi:hypothetical protein OG756_01350 [Streptomyces sp. NBC_01310]|uniref:hypothetical protein n=1 Tax=Streptomyces sp. NBC_01310 TaxID=2903820 RepID=UPI0035B584E7|nr:hypothetical protein OG756_01350 [Streptomyces sp. NBC_01310]
MAASPHWHLKGSPGHGYSGKEAWQLLVKRFDWASFETLFEDGQGRQLAVVTNGERAMVVLTDTEGSPGEHLADPHADGSSGRFPLSYGRIDTYADRDTVTFDLACRAVAHFITHATWPADVSVEDDRRS